MSLDTKRKIRGTYQFSSLRLALRHRELGVQSRQNGTLAFIIKSLTFRDRTRLKGSIIDCTKHKGFVV